MPPNTTTLPEKPSVAPEDAGVAPIAEVQPDVAGPRMPMPEITTKAGKAAEAPGPIADQYDYDEPAEDSIPSGADETPAVSEEPAQAETGETAAVPPEDAETATEAEATDTGPDEALLKAAEEMGIPRALAEEFSPQQLQGVQVAIDRRFAALGRTQAPQPPQPTAPPAQPSAAPQAQPAQQPAEFKIELDESEYDPAIVKTLKGLQQHHTGELQRFQQQVGQALSSIAKVVQGMQGTAQLNRFDSVVSSLDKERFGEGPTANLNQQSLQYQDRVKLHQEAVAIATGYQQMNMTPPSDGELLQRAYHSVFGAELVKKAKASATQEVAKQLTKRRGQMTSRPTHRDTAVPPTSTENVALKKLAQRMRDKRMLGEEEGE